MANKRNLKKQIRYICGDLAGETILAREFLPDVDRDEANRIICDIAELQAENTCKIYFSFDKSARDFTSRHDYRKARRTYFASAFKTMRDEFNRSVGEIVHRMNALAGKDKA